jgi:high-affinity K+ transport system ATPase subunit B
MDDLLDYYYENHTPNQKFDSVLLVGLTIVSGAQDLILVTLYIYAMCMFSKLKKNERTFSTLSNSINLILILCAVIGSLLMTSLIYKDS